MKQILGGLEDPDDLITDLEAGFLRLNSALEKNKIRLNH
jgi:hypothetical protein